MTNARTDTCKGICEKWENLSEEEIEAQNLQWCCRCYVYVKPFRVHCPCCKKTQIYGIGDPALTCLECGKKYETDTKTMQFCSKKCQIIRRKRKRKQWDENNKKKIAEYHSIHSSERSRKRAKVRIKKDTTLYGFNKWTNCIDKDDHIWIDDDGYTKCKRCGCESWRLFFTP